MQIERISNQPSFRGLNFDKSVPEKIVKAIKQNPVIKTAKKNYSLYFNYYHLLSGKDKMLCTFHFPENDTIHGLYLNPPHSLIWDSLWFGKTSKLQGESGVLEDLANLEKTPKIFEQMIPPKRTLRERITALIEAFQISLSTRGDEPFVDKILSKYKRP